MSRWTLNPAPRWAFTEIKMKSNSHRRLTSNNGTSLRNGHLCLCWRPATKRLAVVRDRREGKRQAQET